MIVDLFVRNSTFICAKWIFTASQVTHMAWPLVTSQEISCMRRLFVAPFASHTSHTLAPVRRILAHRIMDRGIMCPTTLMYTINFDSATQNQKFSSSLVVGSEEGGVTGAPTGRRLDSTEFLRSLPEPIPFGEEGIVNN